MRLNIQLFAEGEIIIQATIGTKNFDRQIKYIEERMLEIEHLLEQADKGYEVGDTLKLEAEYEKLGNQLGNLIAKRNELENPITPTIQDNLKGIEASLGGIIKKVGKWALAVFSVRSAYSLVRGAISTLSQTDDGLATRIEYIRWAIATTLKPVIEWVINAVYKLLSLIGGVVKLLTGINIFSNASAENFESMKKSTGAIKSTTGAIKKNLYGWDEMTRVEESGGGALGGISSGIKDIMNELPNLNSMVDEMAEKIKKKTDYLKENAPKVATSWQKGLINVGDLLDTNVGKAMFGITTIDNNWGKTATNVQDGIFKINLSSNNAFKSISLGFGNITSLIEPFKNKAISSATAMQNGFKTAISTIKTYIDGLKTKISNFISSIPSMFSSFGTEVGDYIGGGFKSVMNSIFSYLEKRINSFIDSINNGISKVNSTLGTKISRISRVSFPRLKQGGIVNMPNKGVPIGGAIAGESGVEGVIPLTDSQQMQLLGEAIGRYITINANITNTMNGRIIGRELQKINNENSFASNR